MPQGIDLTKILLTSLMLLAEYRKGREAIKAAGDPHNQLGDLKSDQELIDLFKADSVAATTLIDSLLAKHGAAVPPAPGQ